MNPRNLKADGLLLAAACIWGTSFVAQRMGMEHLGPWTFNAARFAVGALVLLPFWRHGEKPATTTTTPRKLIAGLGMGVVLFCGASLQQLGLVTTTAGKAGFITGLYVILVPVLGLTLGRRSSAGAWLGAGLAVAGLYLLSGSGDLRLAPGDSLVLASAVFWAGHILLLDHWIPRIATFQLAALQTVVCAALSFAGALALEEIRLPNLQAAVRPILYAGVLSVGVAFTLQVTAQRKAPPTHAAILLSLEAVFAALAGWVLLSETLSGPEITGCVLMLAGMLLSQLLPPHPTLSGRSS